jgi:hypothetical protein
MSGLVASMLAVVRRVLPGFFLHLSSCFVFVQVLE